MTLIKIILQAGSIIAVIYGVKYEVGLLNYDVQLIADSWNVAEMSR